MSHLRWPIRGEDITRKRNEKILLFWSNWITKDWFRIPEFRYHLQCPFWLYFLLDFFQVKLWTSPNAVIGCLIIVWKLKSFVLWLDWACQVNLRHHRSFTRQLITITVAFIRMLICGYDYDHIIIITEYMQRRHINQKNCSNS